MINDDVVKEKILKYKNNSNNTTIDDIKNYIFQYVYNYPRINFHVDNYRSTNFYIYYMERFEKMLRSYKITDVKFITWLTYTLRTSYLNYIKQEERYKKNQVEEVSFDTNFFTKNSDEPFNLYALIESPEGTEKGVILEFVEKLDKYIRAKYSDLESLIFRVHHLEIFHTFVAYDIFEYFDISYEEVLAFIEETRETYFYKYRNFTEIQDKISIITSKIIDLEMNNIEEAKIEKLRERKQRYLFRLRQLQIVVPYTYLSNRFDISTNKIAKIVAKIKKDIKADF